ncbi:relaxase/mobilization nuclease domain-containing protein [Agrobacterium rhizogenes]|nr:relaxase/mobilization nuclease domain-containing protein [Rhizobium rhizogenes]
MPAARKVRQKPGPKPKRYGAVGTPYTGSKPRTGAAPMDMRLEEERRKRRRGGAGGSSSPTLSLSQPDKAKLKSEPNTGTGTAAAKVESRIRVAGPQERLAIAGGSQPTVVKLVSYAAGSSRVAKLLTYQSRDSELAVERETGAQMAGGQWIHALADDWAEEDGRQPSKDVLRLSLSVRSDSDKTIGAALKAALPGHRIAWASRPTEAGEGRIVDVVMSAAARAHADQRKVQRIYDNRKSLAGLSARLEDAFGAGTGIEVHGFAHGVEGVGRYLAQVRKGTRHAVWSVRMDRNGSFVGDVVIGAGATSLAEAKDWKRDLRSQERRDVAHIIFSAKPGTPKEQFVDAARATLAREFAGHRYAFVLHEDRQHLHVHAAVKMLSETGQRLHPRIQDFKRWRQTLAEEARERNIPMDAVSRFERANPPGYKLKDIRRVQRGIASDNVRRRVEAVKNGAVHIPVREEGKRRAVASAHGWGHVAAIAAQAVPEIAPEAGVLRLYRAERPGSRSSAPIFTRDRAEAVEMAQRYGGALSFIDVRANEMHQIRPARSQSGMGGGDDRFVVTRELADTMRLVPPAEATTATIMRFRRRGEIAGEYQSPGYQAGRATKETDDMANLDTMKTSFAEMDEQMEVIRKNLPADRQPQIDGLHSKLKQTQQEMLKAQETIEKRRGTVEGETFVQPVKHEFSQFTAEERGEVVRYVHRKANGSIGAVAFTDHGDKVEIARWKDREAVLAAMQVASQKWDALTINGTDSYKAIAVELAAEHGFKITNPELQDKLVAASERIARNRVGRAAIAPGVLPEGAQPETETEAIPASAIELSTPEKSSEPVIDGDKVRPADRDRGAMLAAMREAAKKWDTITVNGSERDKALAVELAAEHGFKISNPELQDKLVAAKEKVDQRRQRELAREEKLTGFVDGSQALRDFELDRPVGEGREAVSAGTTVRQGRLVAHGTAPYEHNPDNDASYYVTLARVNGDQQTIWGVGLEREMRSHRPEIGEHITISYTGSEPVVIHGELRNRHNWQIERSGPSDKITDNTIGRSNAEIAIALETVRERTDAEAQREVRQAERSAATNERPIDGGGEDHAYRTQAEASAAVRAERTVDQNPSKPIPADVNQSPEIERQRQIQQELLAEKQTNRQVEAQKETQKPRQRR